MANIVLARIDDRLIHGQVMTAWLQYTGGNHIMIVDDQTAGDEFTKSIISMAVPYGIGLDIFSVEEGAERLKTIDSSKRIIILAKTPHVFLSLIEKGAAIDEVVIGGMGASKARSKFYKNISATEEEKEIFRGIIQSGTKLRIQIIPDEKSVTVKELLK